VSELLRSVPGLYWVAVVWMLLAYWAEDVRGVYVALACLLLGTVQYFLRERTSR
jgi:tellurite resistance protein TehA-like permease